MYVRAFGFSPPPEHPRKKAVLHQVLQFFQPRFWLKIQCIVRLCLACWWHSTGVRQSTAAWSAARVAKPVWKAGWEGALSARRCRGEAAAGTCATRWHVLELVHIFTDLTLASVHLLCTTVSAATAGINILLCEMPGAGGWAGWLSLTLSCITGCSELMCRRKLWRRTELAGNNL